MLEWMSQHGIHWLWHWSGRCFGYRRGDRLHAEDGQQLGRFVGERIFDQDGFYIGELRLVAAGGHERRLVTSLADTCLQHDGFTPVDGGRKTLPPDRPPIPLPAACRRFPLAGELKRHRAAAPDRTVASDPAAARIA